MSIKQLSLVWEHSIQKGSALLILLSIADNAKENGFAFPGIDYLAKKTRLSPRQVMRIIKAIEKTGELIIDQEKRYNRYIVNIYRPEGLNVTFCKNCGIQAFPELGLDLQQHHIIPRSENGSDEKENMLQICVLCHAKKHEGKEKGLILSSISSDNMSLIKQIQEKTQKGDIQGAISDKKTAEKVTPRAKQVTRVSPKPSVNPSPINHQAKQLTSTKEVEVAASPQPEPVYVDDPFEEPKNNHKPLVGVLSRVTGLDIKMHAPRLGKQAKKLRMAGYTPKQIKETFGKGGAWYSRDWRGKKGDKPSPEMVTEQIKNLLEKPKNRDYTGGKYSEFIKH